MKKREKMKIWINGFGTCFAMFTALGFGLAVWWTYPHDIHTKASNTKMDVLAAAYSIDKRLTVEMIDRALMEDVE